MTYNKYRARKIQFDGESFDSKKEFVRYQELKMLEKAGEIKNLRRQVKYVLIPSQKDELGKVIEREVSYKADFVYNLPGVEYEVVEDVKGFKGSKAYDIFVIKRKMMLRFYGIRIKEV